MRHLVVIALGLALATFAVRGRAAEPGAKAIPAVSPGSAPRLPAKVAQTNGLRIRDGKGHFTPAAGHLAAMTTPRDGNGRFKAGAATATPALRETNGRFTKTGGRLFGEMANQRRAQPVTANGTPKAGRAPTLAEWKTVFSRTNMVRSQ